MGWGRVWKGKERKGSPCGESLKRTASPEGEEETRSGEAGHTARKCQSGSVGPRFKSLLSPEVQQRSLDQSASLSQTAAAWMMKMQGNATANSQSHYYHHCTSRLHHTHSQRTTDHVESKRRQHNFRGSPNPSENFPRSLPSHRMPQRRTKALGCQSQPSQRAAAQSISQLKHLAKRSRTFRVSDFHSICALKPDPLTPQSSHED